jgi:hypothetical protein
MKEMRGVIRAGAYITEKRTRTANISILNVLDPDIAGIMRLKRL